MMTPAISKEGFERYLRRRMDAGIAFTAYWSERGYGLLLTGAVPQTKRRYRLHVPGKPDREYADYQACHNRAMNIKGAWMEGFDVPARPKQTPESRVKRWRKLNEQTRRKCWGEFITVEFDGTSVAIEGGNLDL